jgi:ribulose-5-phosphate 4-epimerase/fuculose-1-phosphate aldolase
MIRPSLNIDEVSMSVVFDEAAIGLGGPMPVAPYVRPTTNELAVATYEASADSMGVIMAHHGLITFDPDLEQALISTLAAESTAKAITLVRAMGANLVTLDQQEARELHQNYLKYYHPARSCYTA